MSVTEIRDPRTGSTASIVVSTGFNCSRFIARTPHDSVSVIYAKDGFENGTKQPSTSGIPILFPYPNRIRRGRYTWNGQPYELPSSLVLHESSGNAIHGFCLDRAWRVVEQSESAVMGVFQISKDAADRRSLWPADAELTVRYSIEGTRLRSEFTVRNPDDEPLPWGLGTHAYFQLPLSNDTSTDHCTIYAPTHRLRELEGNLPTGRILDAADGEALDQSPKFNSMKLDHAFTDLNSQDGVIEFGITDMTSGRSIHQRSTADFRELVAFTPPWARAVCLEPYTCATDAINLHSDEQDMGLKVLAPGNTWTGWIEIEARL